MTIEIRHYPVVDTLIDVFAQWLQHHREVSRDRSCAMDEYARIAHDLGLSKGELSELTNLGSHAADELPKMMAALKLDAKAIARAQPRVMRDMSRVCAHCQDKRRCNDAIMEGTAPDTHADFCANAPTFDALAAQEHGPSMPG